MNPALRVLVFQVEMADGIITRGIDRGLITIDSFNTKQVKSEQIGVQMKRTSPMMARVGRYFMHIASGEVSDQ